MKSKSFGLAWYPIRSKSRNPSVIRRSVRSPFRSSNAFVATVVPILTQSTSKSWIFSLLPIFKKSRMPWMAASLYCSGFSERYLMLFKDPSGDFATISVNVPPRSIQNCHLPSELIVFIDIKL